MVDMRDYGRHFMVSAMTTGFPWEDLRKGIGNYYDDIPKAPTTFLAMFETADGCIKFQEVQKAKPSVTVAVSFPMTGPGPGIASGPDSNDPFDQRHFKYLKRRYELLDRSGPGGMILHYKEMVD